MKNPDTEPSGMPEEDSAPGLWVALTEKFWLKNRGPHAYMFGVVALGALLLVGGAITGLSDFSLLHSISSFLRVLCKYSRLSICRAIRRGICAASSIKRKEGR